MSIQNAMHSGVSGLFANAKRMGYVSNNIANSQTLGYKRQFGDMVSMTAGGRSSDNSATTVRSAYRTDMETQGSTSTTDRDMDAAIIGDGFFVVGRDAEGNPNTTQHRLTRAGSFNMNEDGNLVNSAGYLLYGFKYDEDGNIGAVDRGSFNSLEAVNLSEVDIYGDSTGNIQYNANLPAQQTGQATPPAPFQTSVEYYNELGGTERMMFSWQPTTNDDEWTLTVEDNDGNALGEVDVTFENSGPNAGSVDAYDNINDLSTAPAGFAVDPATGVMTLTLDNGTTPQVIDVEMGAPGTTQRLSQFVGDYSPEGIRKDGAPSAPLERVEFGEDGTLWGVFVGGERKALYDIPLATVVNNEGLVEEEGSAYSLSHQAGTMVLKESGGSTGYMSGGTLERSNVDIAKELTDLIEIQRSYSSNTKVVQTADEMFNETNNLKR